jgi:hypothetical protein
VATMMRWVVAVIMAAVLASITIVLFHDKPRR